MRKTDDRKREYHLPARILAAEGEIENTVSLLREKELQIGLGETDLTKFHGRCSVLLDFGREMCGGIKILTHTADNSRIRIRLGESVTECCAELGEKGASNDHALRDVRTNLKSYSNMEFCQSGFRFARIDFEEPDKMSSVKSVLAVSYLRDLKRLGEFRCSDPLLERIFETAAYTCTLNMQDYLWDGIKRDRLVWMGDFHPEMLTVLSLYGNHEILRKSIAFNVGQAPFPQYMNGLSSYSVWYVAVVCDYYFLTGDEGFVREQLPYLQSLLSQLCAQFTETGDCLLKNYLFDWPTHGTADSLAGVTALCEIAARNAVVLLKQFGANSGTAEQWLKRIRLGTLVRSEYKQVTAFQVLSGRISSEQAASCLKREGARGISAFMSYYVFKALRECGEGEAALSQLREYFGGMLAKGATTFWEDFSVDWIAGSGRIDEFPKPGEKDIHGDYGDFCYKGFRHSLCHGWSSGPVPFLMETVLGVKVTGAGCTRVRIEPKLYGLDYAEGSFPTPFGKIEISAKKDARGGVSVNIEAPEGVNIERTNP